MNQICNYAQMISLPSFDHEEWPQIQRTASIDNLTYLDERVDVVENDEQLTIGKIVHQRLILTQKVQKNQGEIISNNTRVQYNSLERHQNANNRYDSSDKQNFAPISKDSTNNNTQQIKKRKEGSIFEDITGQIYRKDYQRQIIESLPTHLKQFDQKLLSRRFQGRF